MATIYDEVNDENDYYYDSSSSSSALSSHQQVAVALIPKFTSFLSIMAQLWVIAEVTHSKKKRNSFYHRLLSGLSVASILRGVAMFFSTWPIPSDVDGENDTYAYNVGTERSCQIQGFLIQCGLTSPVYMIVISLYYWLTIRCGWAESYLKEKEIWLHILPWFCGLLTAFIGLFLNLYDPADLYCWISQEYGLYRLLLYYFPLWTSFISMVYFFSSFYCAIREEEIKTLRYRHPQLFMLAQDNSSSLKKIQQPLQSFSGKNNENEASLSMPTPPSSSSTTSTLLQSKVGSSFIGDHTNQQQQYTRSLVTKIWRKYPEAHSLTVQISHQMLWYVVAFFVSHISGSLYRLLQALDIEPYGLLVVMAILDPLQGFFDFCVYRRPMFLRLRKQNPKDNIGRCIFKTLQWPGIEGKNKRLGKPNQLRGNGGNGSSSSSSSSPSVPVTSTCVQLGDEVETEIVQHAIPPPQFLEQSQKRTKNEHNSPNHCINPFGPIVNANNSDPFGALAESSDDDDEDFVTFHATEEQRLFFEGATAGTAAAIGSSGSSNSKNNNHDDLPAPPTSNTTTAFHNIFGSGFRKTPLPNIKESEVLEESEMISQAMQAIIENETEVDACLARESMFGRLADLDIIEEVPEWVSTDVKIRINRQRSMPVLGSSYSNTPDNNFNGSEKISDSEDEDDIMPPPPDFSVNKTV